jgi:lipoyl-dependent peroxiredoxin
MPDKVLYTAEATSNGDGRNGHVATSDGRIDLDLAFPPEMGGTGAGSNPEQLFAAGYAACFHSALRLVAGRGHAALGDSTVTAQVGIGPEGDAFGLLVTLVIHVPGMERDKVREFADAAHQVCPYSRATRGNISVELRVLLSPGGPRTPRLRCGAALATVVLRQVMTAQARDDPVPAAISSADVVQLMTWDTKGPPGGSLYPTSWSGGGNGRVRHGIGGTVG